MARPALRFRRPSAQLLARLRYRHRERLGGKRGRQVDAAVVSRFARPVELELLRTLVLVAVAMLAILVVLPTLLGLAPG